MSQSKAAFYIFLGIMSFLGSCRVPESDLLEYSKYLSLSLNTGLLEYLLWFSKDPLYFLITYYIGQLLTSFVFFKGLLVCVFGLLIFDSVKGIGKNSALVATLLITSSYIFSLQLHLVRQFLALAVYLGVAHTNNNKEIMLRSCIAALIHFSFIPFILLEVFINKSSKRMFYLTLVAAIAALIVSNSVLRGFFSYAIVRATAGSYKDFGMPSLALLLFVIAAPIIACVNRKLNFGNGYFVRISILSLVALLSLLIQTEIFYRIIPVVTCFTLMLMYRRAVSSTAALVSFALFNSILLFWSILYGKWSYVFI